MKGEISGEMMRQDELTSQMSENIQKVVQKALREELAHFRLEQTKILREAVEEVLPEMEQRMFEKISGKSHFREISSPGYTVQSTRNLFYPGNDIFPPTILISHPRLDIQVNFMEYHWFYVFKTPPPPKKNDI